MEGWGGGGGGRPVAHLRHAAEASRPEPFEASRRQARVSEPLAPFSCLPLRGPSLSIHWEEREQLVIDGEVATQASLAQGDTAIHTSLVIKEEKKSRHMFNRLREARAEGEDIECILAANEIRLAEIAKREDEIETKKLLKRIADEKDAAKEAGFPLELAAANRFLDNFTVCPWECPLLVDTKTRQDKIMAFVEEGIKNNKQDRHGSKTKKV